MRAGQIARLRKTPIAKALITDSSYNWGILLGLNESSINLEPKFDHADAQTLRYLTVDY